MIRLGFVGDKWIGRLSTKRCSSWARLRRTFVRRNSSRETTSKTGNSSPLSLWLLFLNLILIRLLYFRWVTTFQPKMRLRSAIWTFGDTATSPKTMPMNLVWVNVKFKLPHQFPDLIPHQTLSRGELIKAEWRVLEGLVTRSSYCHQLIHCSDLFRRCIYFSFFVVTGRSISNPWMVLTPPRHFV